MAVCGDAPADEFTRAYRSGKVIFFAGSGISYASGLPSAEELLRRTSTATVPIATEDELSAMAGLQPELFYEAMIQASGNRECLHIWRSLHGATREEAGCPARPSAVHRLLVRYSARHAVPIFTTNFDTMFEEAAHELSCRPTVFGPHDAPPSAWPGPAICKLHGSIERQDGHYAPESLWTTATEISTFNRHWVDRLILEMKARHIAFVGYSGRDIDLFPHISRISAACDEGADFRKPFWLHVFAADPHADRNAAACRAVRLDGQWPEQRLRAIEPAEPVEQVPPTADEIAKAGALLDRLQEELRQRVHLSPAEQRIFLSFVKAHAHDYYQAERVLQDISEADVARLPARQRAAYWFARARSAHERSHYVSLGRYGKQALACSWRHVDDIIHALTILSESKRMQVPADTYYSNGRWVMAALAAGAFCHFGLTAMAIGVIMALSGKSLGRLVPASRHAVIEHFIRWLAIIQRFVIPWAKRRDGLLHKIMVRSWTGLFILSHRHGYAAGMANAYKFQYRIAPALGQDKAIGIYQLFQFKTGAELTTRNLADQAMDDGDWEKALALFHEFFLMARSSGNTLNAVKGMLGMFRTRELAGIRPVASPGEISEFKSLAAEVEGVFWRWHFASVGARLVQGDSR